MGKKMKLPELIIELNKIKSPKVLVFHFGRITNWEGFVSSHVSFLLNNPGKKRFLPYYNRLLEFYQANHPDNE